jgi:hypothetical protein
MEKKMPAERAAAMWQEANINLSTKRPAGSSKKKSAKKRQRQVQRSQVEEGFLLRKHKSSLAINLQEYKNKKENSSNNQSET